jgi:nitrate reductase alpha subunit
VAEDAARLDGPAADVLLRTGRFFSRWDETDDGRAVFRRGGRRGDVFYRDRWSHDKVVRSTHGVNCTGSCSWKVYVKDGIITWESQQTDYPSAGPDRPDYEPRGCPRGAAFSWYTYSPTRVRFPYARGVLVDMYREAKARLGDPVLAWADVVGDPADAGPTSRPAARAAWSACHGMTPSRWSPQRTYTRSRRMDRIAVPGSRRSRRSTGRSTFSLSS